MQPILFQDLTYNEQQNVLLYFLLIDVVNKFN